MATEAQLIKQNDQIMNEKSGEKPREVATTDTQFIDQAPPLDVLLGWKNYGKTTNQKQRWEWFVIDQFLKGNHDITGNPQDNTITVRRGTDAINFPINKMWSIFRAVRAYVTRHKPFVEVDPDRFDPNAIAYARQANALLKRDNKLNNFRKINKDWVYFGVKYGLGIREVAYDPVKKCCIRYTIDPADFIIVSRTGELKDAPVVIKCISRTVNYWKNKYPDKADIITPDGKLAEDEYKDMGLQIEVQGAVSDSGSIRDEESNMMGYEASYRIYKKNRLGGFVNKVTFCEGGVLKFEQTPFDDYPFICYKADLEPNKAAGQGHMKHVVAPQRLIDLLNTQMLEYNHIVNRGRFIKDKNSGFKVINTKEGQIIEKNAGKVVQVLNPPGINPLLDKQLQWAIDFAQDIGGQHDASRGAVPQRVSSGDAIEALQAGDSNNISDLRDNFEDALAEEAAWILKMYSLFEKGGIAMQNKIKDGEVEKFAVMGSEAYLRTGDRMPDRYFSDEDGGYVPVCAILADNNVTATVSSQLGETKDAQMNLLFKLADYGLPIEVILKHLEFPNVSDIMDQIAAELAGDIAAEQLKAAPQLEMAKMQAQSQQNAQLAAAQKQTDGQKGQIVQRLSQLRQRAGGGVARA